MDNTTAHTHSHNDWCCLIQRYKNMRHMDSSLRVSGLRPQVQGPGSAPEAKAMNREATDFLYACMRDRSLPLRQRIKAAGKLMALGEFDGPPPPTLLIKIQGFICPELIDTWESFSSEEQAELLNAVKRLMRCNELGTGELKATWRT